MMKVCSGCKESKDESEYSKKKKNNDGLQSECKLCAKQRREKRIENNPSYFSDALKKHLDKKPKTNKVFRGNPFEKGSDEYNNYVKNKERERQARYRKSDNGKTVIARIAKKSRDKRKLATKASAAKRYLAIKSDPVKYQQYRENAKRKQSEWYQKNKCYFKSKWHERRSRIKGNGGTHTSSDIQEILESQKHKCVACGVSIKSKRHIDHIIPLSKGGTNDKANIQLLCPCCNISKNDKHPIDFMQSKGFLL